MAAFWSRVSELDDGAGAGAGDAVGAGDGAALAVVPDVVPVAPLLLSACPTESDGVDMY